MVDLCGENLFWGLVMDIFQRGGSLFREWPWLTDRFLVIIGDVKPPELVSMLQGVLPELLGIGRLSDSQIRKLAGNAMHRACVGCLAGFRKMPIALDCVDTRRLAASGFVYVDRVMVTSYRSLSPIRWVFCWQENEFARKQSRVQELVEVHPELNFTLLSKLFVKFGLCVLFMFWFWGRPQHMFVFCHAKGCVDEFGSLPSTEASLSIEEICRSAVVELFALMSLRL